VTVRIDEESDGGKSKKALESSTPATKLLIVSKKTIL
jgi:hypothetical protein